MQRKLIKQGGTGLTVYLPKKWIDKSGLEPGDLVDINEKGSELVIMANTEPQESSIDVNIKDLERNALIKTITAYYESGYSEIMVIKSKERIYDPWSGKRRGIEEEIEFIASRLIGFEIIRSDQKQIVLKDIAKTSPNEFDNTLRRIFRLIIEFQDKLKEHIHRKEFLSNYEDLHNKITKFISFCLRLLSVNIDYSDIQKNCLHTILTILDKVTDSMRYLSRATKKSIRDRNHIYNIMEHFSTFYSLFYSGRIMQINELDEERKKLKEHSPKEMPCIEFATVLEYVQAMIKPTIILVEMDGVQK